MSWKRLRLDHAPPAHDSWSSPDFSRTASSFGACNSKTCCIDDDAHFAKCARCARSNCLMPRYAFTWCLCLHLADDVRPNIVLGRQLQLLNHCLSALYTMKAWYTCPRRSLYYHCLLGSASVDCQDLDLEWMTELLQFTRNACNLDRAAEIHHFSGHPLVLSSRYQHGPRPAKFPICNVLDGQEAVVEHLTDIWIFRYILLSPVVCAISLNTSNLWFALVLCKARRDSWVSNDQT